LVARPIATKTHFPYLPGMLAFGVPRALDGRSPLADARVWFALVTLAAPHLVLQVAPEESAQAIHEFVAATSALGE
jgi:hypothetical protein